MTTAVPTPPPTPANSATHIDTLDGVRGIAILLVMLTHGAWFFRSYPTAWYYLPIQGGWSGVDLFFVLSGYLITGILLRTKTAKNRAQSFYMRRVLRIFPLYYGALLALFIGIHFSWWLRASFPGHGWRPWLIYVLYLQNWAVLHNPAYLVWNIIGHFWSLAVEEQFYLVWPWLVWALSPRTIIKLCIGGMIGSLILRLLLMWHFGPSNWSYQFALTPTRGEGLLMGAALAACSVHFGRIPKRLLASMAGAGLAILLLLLAFNTEVFFSEATNAYRFTIGVTGFVLLYGALVGSSQYKLPYVTSALEWAWLRSFGKYSYGIYVYHVPLFVFVGHVMNRAGFPSSMRARYAIVFWSLNVAIAYGIAWLSFHFFEAHFLRMKDRFRPMRPTKPALQDSSERFRTVSAGG